MELPLPLDIILKLVPGSQAVYGILVLLLLVAIRYLKTQVTEKDRVIRELFIKSHKAWEAVSEKLTEIKINTQEENLSRHEMIRTLSEIEKRLNDIQIPKPKQTN